MSQPSISSAIKRLETYFQAKLIGRGHATADLKFTPAGEQLYQHAASILNELDSAHKEITICNHAPQPLGCHHPPSKMPILPKLS